ncbi:energy-coupling factor transporter transmembrane component T [Streptomyces sp. SL13]|jgi:energy-coupling factor transport system permease protein|uniref:Energy-coupling factor transporter transmembrane component T n=1 Tax=Streptantibioticus silvisoli TaxID=2705255 RepID=A0AA90GZJ4_9ACTN|nr:energy-coupling factor transporter transmembrane component T [Streptantibioticus silvisoli]MDI5963270.1 energy-coupling factor transporter transmembrane component T [Streptantibioticus silvisoli]MDI5968551.1 energy-coupling factor transporter transmembrane component T [Streptantibioticus silvisoli]
MRETVHASGTSRIHRLNPVTKLTFAVAVTVCAFAMVDYRWPLLLFCVVVLPAAIAAGVVRRFLLMLAALWAPVAVAVLLVQGFFFPGAHDVIARLGPLKLSSEGVSFAVQTALHILVLMGGFFLLLLTTHASALMSALSERKVSPNVIYIVSAAVQIVPTFNRRATSILHAQQARGQTIHGLRGRMRALAPLMGPLVLSAFIDVGERAAAMETRGFGATRRPTNLTVVADSGAQRGLRAAMLLCALVSIVVNVWGVVR